MSLSRPGIWRAITLHDTNAQPDNIRAIYVGATAGNMVVSWGDGNVTIPVLANTIYPVLFPLRILSTGTTATALFGIF